MFGWEGGGVQAAAHVLQPGGHFGFPDANPMVAHAQAGVVPLFGVGAGTAGILHQE